MPTVQKAMPYDKGSRTTQTTIHTTVPIMLMAVKTSHGRTHLRISLTAPRTSRAEKKPPRTSRISAMMKTCRL